MAVTTERKEYLESDAVKQAKALLDQQSAAKPGAYQSQWQTQLNDTMDKILNREKFQFDLNGDALYQQYKDRYVNQGKMAMMDTMGQAAALTGGYGNSYAQNVGQQAYQGHLQGLNDVIPELYQLALDQYDREGNALKEQYAILGDRESEDYGRYRDSVSDWQNEYNRLYGAYRDEQSYDYGMHRDAVADQQWQAEFDEAKRRYDQEWEAAQAAKSSKGSRRSYTPVEEEEEKEEEVPTVYTFADVGKKAQEIAATGGDAGAYINAARQAGVITTAQYKSLKYTFGF